MYAGATAPKCDETWVYDMVLRAVQTLFFEAMKRWLSNGGDRQKMRLLYVGFTEYERLSNNPMRLMSDEAEELIHLEGEALFAKDAPNLSHVQRVPWLMNELYSVTEFNALEIRHAVKRKHWEAWSEQHPEEFASTEAAAGPADTETEAAPAEATATVPMDGETPS